MTTISDHDQNRRFRTNHLQAGLGGRSARGGAVTMSAQVFKFVFSTAATIVLARLLTPQDYGLIGTGSFCEYLLWKRRSRVVASET